MQLLTGLPCILVSAFELVQLLLHRLQVPSGNCTVIYGILLSRYNRLPYCFFVLFLYSFIDVFILFIYYNRNITPWIQTESSIVWCDENLSSVNQLDPKIDFSSEIRSDRLGRRKELNVLGESISPLFLNVISQKVWIEFTHRSQLFCFLRC